MLIALMEQLWQHGIETCLEMSLEWSDDNPGSVRNNFISSCFMDGCEFNKKLFDISGWC